MRKTVVYRWSSPTGRQLDYLALLARRIGVEIPRPRTRAEASAYIDALKRRGALPRRPAGSLRTGLRALVRGLHGLPPEPGTRAPR